MNKKNKPHDLFFVERGAELFPQYAPALIYVKTEFTGTLFLVIVQMLFKGVVK